MYGHFAVVDGIAQEGDFFIEIGETLSHVLELLFGHLECAKLQGELNAGEGDVSAIGVEGGDQPKGLVVPYGVALMLVAEEEVTQHAVDEGVGRGGAEEGIVPLEAPVGEVGDDVSTVGNAQTSSETEGIAVHATRVVIAHTHEIVEGKVEPGDAESRGVGHEHPYRGQEVWDTSTASQRGREVAGFWRQLGVSTLTELELFGKQQAHPLGPYHSSGLVAALTRQGFAPVLKVQQRRSPGGSICALDGKQGLSEGACRKCAFKAEQSLVIAGGPQLSHQGHSPSIQKGRFTCTPQIDKIRFMSTSSPKALQENIARCGEEIYARLESRGHLHRLAPRMELELAPQIAHAISLALELEASSDDPLSAARSDNLVCHYTERMPALLVELIAANRGPQVELVHASLNWAELPRLARVLERLESICDAHAIPVERFLGASSVEAYASSHATFAEAYVGLHFGRCMPPLYGFPNDFIQYHAELEAGASPMQVLDHRLASPLAHEWMHGRTDREVIPSPYLDECIAGYLGVLLRPQLAFPDPGQDNGLFRAPRLSQVGQSLASVTGVGALLAAQAGIVPWREVLGEELLEAVETISWALYAEGREVHFLSGLEHPELWHKLFALARADQALPKSLDGLRALDWRDIPLEPSALDEEIWQHSLRAAGLAHRIEGGVYRVWSEPPRGVVVDAERCVVFAEREPGEGYLLAPSVALEMRARGEEQRRLSRDAWLEALGTGQGEPKGL